MVDELEEPIRPKLTIELSDGYDCFIRIDGEIVGMIQRFTFGIDILDLGQPKAKCVVHTTPTSGTKHLELLKKISWIEVEERKIGFAEIK